AGTAVGTDLVYAAVTKTFGAARHHQLKNVNRELALWMATGSVPAAFLGTYSLYNLFDANIDAWLPEVIGYTLVAVGIAVTIGAVFGFILGLTSVGSGVFFGMALVTVFPLTARKVVGTDLLHAMMV